MNKKSKKYKKKIDIKIYFKIFLSVTNINVKNNVSDALIIETFFNKYILPTFHDL